MLVLIVSAVFSATILLIFKILNSKPKPPIIGMYQQAGKFYWLKFTFMYLILVTKKWIKILKRRLSVELGKSGDGNIHVHNDDVALENVQPLGDYTMAVDGVYFNGASKGGAALTCGVTRRQHGRCDAFMLLKVEGKELMLSPKLPDSYLEQKDDEAGGYSAEGIVIEKLVPMRSWRIQYNGDMRLTSDPEKTVKVELSLTWSTAFAPFNYEEISPLSMAKDVAREPWSADFFKNLKKNRQTHYEQIGEVVGTVNIDGTTHQLKMPCVRDHNSSEHRDWNNIHRYVYHFIHLENGDCVAVGAASQPLTVSHLTIGYYGRKSEQTVKPIRSSSFKLYEHGENQTLPRDYGFSFNIGGQTCHVQVSVKDETTFFMGKNREAKFYERWCSYKVNDMNGWGSSEWYYNNVNAGK